MKYADGYIAVQQVINNLGSNHNLSLARLGTAKKCVFVEGKDIKSLAKIQEILGIESNVSVDQLPTVELGGWTRFDEALGAARLFYNQTSGTIRTYCILDRDYHTQEEIDKLYQRAKESNLILHIWQKKEIENYLLTPSSLFRISEEPEENREIFGSSRKTVGFWQIAFQHLARLRREKYGGEGERCSCHASWLRVARGSSHNFP